MSARAGRDTGRRMGRDGGSAHAPSAAGQLRGLSRDDELAILKQAHALMQQIQQLKQRIQRLEAGN